MKSRVIIDSDEYHDLLKRLAMQVAEKWREEKEICILGIQKAGALLAEQLFPLLKEFLPKTTLHLGSLDITFHRDDYRKAGVLLKPNTTEIVFSLEQKLTILVDDVLFTGRTIRAALDAMLAYGRPSIVELLVLIDRKGHRQLPIEAQYTGKTVVTNPEERITLEIQNQQVLLVNYGK